MWCVSVLSLDALKRLDGAIRALEVCLRVLTRVESLARSVRRLVELAAPHVPHLQRRATTVGVYLLGSFSLALDISSFLFGVSTDLSEMVPPVKIMDSRTSRLLKFYRREDGVPIPSSMGSGPVWFVPVSSSDDPMSVERTSYGPDRVVYKPKMRLRLLNLGCRGVRSLILSSIPSSAALSDLLDPDVLYQGTGANRAFHEELRQRFGTEYDGTYVSGDDASWTDCRSWEGPHEVVLWGDLPSKLRVTNYM